MLEREKAPDGGELPPFWTKATEVMGGQKQSVYFNTITSSSTATRPVSVRGGILADDMGMGKSVQVLSLWLAHPPDLTTAQQASAHSPPAPKVAKFQNLSKKELQKACRDRGLATTGTKDVLTQRLLQPASEDVVDLTGDTSSGELAAVNPQTSQPSGSDSLATPSPRSECLPAAHSPALLCSRWCARTCRAARCWCARPR
jgi:hypothetical protein